MNSRSTIIFLGFVAVAIIIVIIGLVGRALSPATSSPAAVTASPTAAPNAVKITLLTSDTKAEWVRLVTDAFNKAENKVASGKPIYVEILQEDSPSGAQQAVLDGALQPTVWSPGDMSWVETANQLARDRGKTPLVTADCPSIVLAANGFAMWRPMAEAMGWPDKPIGWDELVALAADPQGWGKYGHPEWGAFKLGHAHPAYSNTGFSMMAALAYAALDKTSGLTPEMVKSQQVVDAFRQVELHTYHYGLSTRALLTLMATRGPAYLHAVTSSETAMLKSYEVYSNTMRYPYAFIFPAEGTFWSYNPYCILETDWVSAEQREAAQIYRDYLLKPEQQASAVKIGLRPTDPNVPLQAPIALSNGTDPRVTPKTVPPLGAVSGDAAAALIDVFHQTKKKATVVLAIDTSGSMEGEKINNAVEATANFLSRLDRDDEVYVLTFSDDVQELSPAGRVGDVSETLAKTVRGLFAQGNTALFDSVCRAAERVGELKAADEAAGEQRLYGVVVLSDGKDTASQKRENDMFSCLPSGEDVEGLKVFTIAYGSDADKDLLLRIANRTNGKTFSGDPKTIEQVYLSISAEQ